MILKDELLYTVSPSSVQFSCSVLPDFLRPPELQHARPPCPTPNTRVIPNPCPLIQWCHPTTSSSVAPSPPALNFPCIRVFSSESALHIRWLKYWSFSFNISPSHVHPGLISFRMDWLDHLADQGTVSVFSNITVQKHQFCAQLSSQSNSHIHTWPLDKP